MEAKDPGALFPADAEYARHMAELAERVGATVAGEVAAIVARQVAGTDGSVVPAAQAAELIERYDIGSGTELALLALPVARTLANPPISGYRVAAVGVEAESGDLVLGGNLEFPGTELSTTIHAEGFVSLRARRRGRTLSVLAVPEAHPCAHCRQALAESAGADQLAIVDPLGHRLSLGDLYPWGFRPAALGMAGDAPGRVNWPNLAFEAGRLDAALPPEVATLLQACGARAHAPYSGAPSAAAIRTRDGRLFGAGCVESVAFNPSISALQAALVELAAHRGTGPEVTDAWLARTQGGAVDPEPGFRSLLGAVAPAAVARVVEWRIDG